MYADKDTYRTSDDYDDKAVAVAKRDTHVQQSINVLDEALAELHGTAQELESRLSGVLRSEAEGDVPGHPEESAIVPLADAIRDLYKRATRTRGVLSSIISRLEL